MEDIESLFTGKLTHIIDPLERNAVEESIAAILVLFVNVEEEWNIVFTRRTNNVRTHQSEVSFPGGAYETGDVSLVQTALRETREEIGVDPKCVKILGGLNPVRTISNFYVYPFIGLLDCEGDFVPNPDEVERVFLVPVKWLIDEKNIFEKDHVIDTLTVKRVIHYHDYDGEHLWGLTARITQEILAKLR